MTTLSTLKGNTQILRRYLESWFGGFNTSKWLWFLKVQRVERVVTFGHVYTTVNSILHIIFTALSSRLSHPCLSPYHRLQTSWRLALEWLLERRDYCTLTGKLNKSDVFQNTSIHKTHGLFMVRLPTNTKSIIPECSLMRMRNLRPIKSRHWEQRATNSLLEKLVQFLSPKNSESLAT